MTDFLKTLWDKTMIKFYTKKKNLKKADGYA